MKKWIAIGVALVGLLGVWSTMRAHERHVQFELEFDDA